MMMSLGLFLFEIGTLPYQQLARSSEYRFAESERFGARSAQQFTGEGDDKITLSGALYPAAAPDLALARRGPRRQGRPADPRRQ